MRVLLLSPYRAALSDAFARAGDEIVQTDAALDAAPDADFIVSYGYRFRLSPEIVAAFPGRIVNLHISLLPWNRGADPNFWSWVDGTPKGVSIHAIDDGLDSGPLHAQEGVEFSGRETLRTSYERLRRRADGLFSRAWPMIRAGRSSPWLQPAGGTYHRATDKDSIFSQLPLGFDTPCAELAQFSTRPR